MNNNKIKILALIILIDMSGFGLIMPLLPYIASRTNATPFEIGALSGIFSLAQVIFSPIWGHYSDKWGRKPILLIGLFGSIISYLILSIAPNIEILLLSRAFNGAFAATIACAFAYGSDISNSKNKTTIMGLLGAALGLGFVIGPIIGGIVSESFFIVKNQVVIPALISCLLSLIAFILTLLKLPESLTKEARLTQNKSENNLSYKSIFQNRSLLKILSICFLSMISFATFEAIYALWAKDNLNWTHRDTSYAFALVGIVIVIVQGGLIKYLSKKVTDLKMLITAIPLFALSFALIPLVYDSISSTIVLILLASSWAIISPTTTSLVAKYSPHNKVGLLIGISRTVGSFARFIASFCAGAEYQHISQASPFWSVTIALAIMFLITITIKSSKKTNPLNSPHEQQ